MSVEEVVEMFYEEHFKEMSLDQLQHFINWKISEVVYSDLPGDSLEEKTSFVFNTIHSINSVEAIEKQIRREIGI